VLGNKQAFLGFEGVELMILLLRKKQSARFGALRVLDFILMGGPASRTAATTVVDKLGLKVRQEARRPCLVCCLNSVLCRASFQPL
jgi:hypothetical protein